MVTRAKKSAIGYYLIAIAVVFGFMAFTLMPASADGGSVNPPVIGAPSYAADDPDLIAGAETQVKIGDKVTLKFKDLPAGDLEFIRFSELLRKDSDGEVPPPKYEITSKEFKADAPSKETEIFEYTVPCWSETSKDASDQLNVQANLFFKDGSTKTGFATFVVLNSNSICKEPTAAPTPAPNFDAAQRDGKTASTSAPASPSPSTPVAANPTVTVSPLTAQQTGEFLFTIEGLPAENSTKMTITLASKEQATMGNPAMTIVENKATNGNPTFPFNWHVPCDVKPGKYAVTVDVITSSASVPSADSEVFTVTAGDCPQTPPSQDPTSTPSQSADPQPSQSADPQPSTEPSQSADPQPSQSEDPQPSTDPSEDTDNPDVTLKLFDDAGNEISGLPRNQRLTIKTTYDGDAESVAFSLHSKPFDLGNAVVKNGAAQIDFMIPCSFPVGKHEVIAKFAGKAPLIVKKPVVVTAGNCKAQPPVLNANTAKSDVPLTPFVSSGTSGATGPALAQTGTASMLLGMLSIMFAGTGLYLIISRREHV